MPIQVQWISAIILTITCLLLVYDLEWQVNAGLLAAQYVSVLFLLLVFWPVNMAGGFFIAGWVSILIIAITMGNQNRGAVVDVNFLSFGKIFHLLAGLLIMLVILTSFGNLTKWFPSATPPLLISSLSLILLGFLSLAFSKKTEKSIFSLLSILSGFEVAYTQVDNSIMMVTLISITMLLISFVGIYMITLERQEA